MAGSRPGDESAESCILAGCSLVQRIRTWRISLKLGEEGNFMDASIRHLVCF